MIAITINSSYAISNIGRDVGKGIRKGWKKLPPKNHLIKFPVPLLQQIHHVNIICPLIRDRIL